MNAYCIETHMHTAESSPCGKVRAKRITRMYKDAGYAGIVVTDHFSEGAFRHVLQDSSQYTPAFVGDATGDRDRLLIEACRP
jgi:L-amino acid N-acyltransferase YncA